APGKPETAGAPAASEAPRALRVLGTAATAGTPEAPATATAAGKKTGPPGAAPTGAISTFLVHCTLSTRGRRPSEPFSCSPASLPSNPGDRKSTRLNSSHVKISSAVF